MSLDIFDRDAQEATQYADRHSAPDLPATYSETFQAAWRHASVFGNSVAGDQARVEAFFDYADEYRKRTGGKDIFPATLNTIGGYQGALDDFNAQVRKTATERPDLGLVELSEKDIEDRAAQIGQRARSDFQRMQQREKTAGGTFGNVMGSISGAMSDPVNLITFPLAAPESLGIIGTAAAWGGIAGGSQLAIEAVGNDFREKVEPGYIRSGESGMNVATATLFGGAMGGAFKSAAAGWTRYKTGSWPRTIRDAGNVVESEANIEAGNRFGGAEGEVYHRTALQNAIDDLVSGRPAFEQRPLPEGGVLAAYDAKLAPVLDARARAAQAQESAVRFERDAARLPPTMERLTEVQLGEFRAAAQQGRQEAEAARASLSAERQAIESERGVLTRQQEAQKGSAVEIDGLRSDIARAEQRIAEARPPTDPATQARLDEIDRDLAATKNNASRAILEAERAQITETLAKTAPGDRRLLASLNAEKKGLEKALARAEKAAAKAQAETTRGAERIAARERAVPAREQSIAARESARTEASATGLRRAIQTLSEEGYGLRLPRDDAEAIAARVLAASDDEVETVLRDVTEDLVSRAVELRRAAPSELPFGAPNPVAEQTARAGYHTEEMRKHVTALAREVGYEMPREEAAAIAARLAGMSDEDALTVLDELMLRPRTLLETLPGTAPAKPPENIQKPSAAPAVAALRDDLTPARIEELRTDADVADTMARDLDKLVAERPDLEVPVGVEIGPDGKPMPVMRKVDSAIAEADQRELASKEIMACVGPYPAEAA